MKGFCSILIANRGEIALRIARTARKLGYRVIAVYSDADNNAPHARLADQAIYIGGSAPHDSYLNIPAVLAAARSSSAQAVHPGYGFLAENADFAQAVLDAGLVWIGPPPAAMRAMGNKAQAKRRMLQAGVRCIPGYQGELQDDATLRAAAARIGFPIMVKAAAGGGGRGMRLVDSASSLDAALTSARSEAVAAFGDPALLLESAVIGARHVEIQVFADAFGNVVHLGERDCSVQRRHQKLIEEAPSPALAGEPGRQLRRRMGEMAVAAARAIDYRGAGTIEYLLDAQGDFYFMEMNTRLQVEHPVTEALTGYDLVEWQLRIAQGGSLPETAQDRILQRYETGGHAVEVRLCAEDSANGFLPDSGQLLAWQPDTAVRVEHALQPGMEIAPFYDSMVAKFIAHGPDRATACTALASALRASVVLGVRTNQGFLAACLDNSVFAAGQADTEFITSQGAAVQAVLQPVRPTMAALALYAAHALQSGHDPARVALPLAWPVPMRFTIDRVHASAEVSALGADRYRVVCGDAAEDLRLAVCCANGAQLAMEVVSQTGRELLTCVADGSRLFLAQNGHQSIVDDRTLFPRASAGVAGAGTMRAPMAGRIASLYVHAGQSVAKGTVLLVLEAMKMEHPSIAPMDALVARVCVEPGAQVATGALLVELTPQPASAPAP